MILKVTHNAGFFSNCTIRLLEIVEFFNTHHLLPSEVDSSEQFIHYKVKHEDNMMPVYFNQEAEQLDVKLQHPIIVPDFMAIQFETYRNLDYPNLMPLVLRYFMPSNLVLKLATEFQYRYALDYKNLCSVFYRGNDKAREMKVAPYNLFIEKAREIKQNNPDIKFLVQPDEEEFLDAFLKAFPDSIYFKETPMLKKQDSAVFFETPLEERPMYGAKFFAAVLCLSQCKHVITHSGNGALWLALYRGKADGINQIFNNEWL